MYHATLETPRFVDDPFEQAGDRVRAERPFRRDAPHMRQHLLLPLGLIHLDAELFLDPADLARDARALVQQPDKHLVHSIDVVAQIVESRHRYTCTRYARRGRPSGRPECSGRPAGSGRPAPFNHRTYCSTRGINSGVPLSSAITDTSALPTTAASAYAPTSATCSGREIPNPSAIGSVVWRRMRPTIASAPDATCSRAPVTPSREIAYRKPL